MVWSPCSTPLALPSPALLAVLAVVAAGAEVVEASAAVEAAAEAVEGVVAASDKRRQRS